MTTTPNSYDFDDNLEGLTVFMKSQPEFADYNFEGSGIRALMRLLAYDAQQRAFQNQFVYNELSLGTASLRENIVGHAADLGYFSRGRTAAKMVVDIIVTPKDVPTEDLILDKTARFFANLDGNILFFTPSQEYTASYVNGVFTFKGVTLVQGIWSYASFVAQSDNAVENFVIPEPTIDTDTLTVQVRPNDTSQSYDVFTKFSSAYDLGPVARVFFLRENRDGLFEMEFGDGKVAKSLKYGSVVLVEYLATSGETGNGIKTITPATSIGGYYDIKIGVSDGSFGGAEKEDVESIRRAAPLGFAAQGSAVNERDYEATTREIFPEAKSVIAWGGENNRPIKIGYTFVAVSLKSGIPLSETQKNFIKTELEKYNVGSIDVVVVDPEYVYLIVDTTVAFNPRNTVLRGQSFKAKISDQLIKFSSDKLEAFNTYFNKSKLVEFINKIDGAITGNKTTVKYQKRFKPTLNFSGTYDFDFSRTLQQGSVLIENFIVSDNDSTGYAFFISDSAGVLKLSKRDLETGNVVFLQNVGQIDYVSGRLDLVGFRPISIIGDYVSLKVTPVGDESLQSFGKDILLIAEKNISLEESYD